MNTTTLLHETSITVYKIHKCRYKKGAISNNPFPNHKCYPSFYVLTNSTSEMITSLFSQLFCRSDKMNETPLSGALHYKTQLLNVEMFMPPSSPNISVYKSLTCLHPAVFKRITAQSFSNCIAKVTKWNRPHSLEPYTIQPDS